jgi:hypothetical protein
MMGTPVHRLPGLSPQAFQALRKAGLETVEAAAALSDEALLSIKGMGESSLMRIRAHQRGEPPPPPQTATAAAAQRFDRVFQLYLFGRQQGKDSATALNNAVEELAMIEDRLREGTA